MSFWTDYIPEDYKIGFAPQSRVLDVGCGAGEQMTEIAGQECAVYGIDLDSISLLSCRRKNLSVLYARAERIPFESRAFDGILCKVVLPYTNEDAVLREFGRLLKPGGVCYVSGHGAGYFLKYLLTSPSIKERFYGLRSLVNTWLWVITKRRLPGFLGDTLYQSRRRMAKYFDENDFSIIRDTPSKRFAGFPVFIYQTIEKNGESAVPQH